MSNNQISKNLNDSKIMKESGNALFNNGQYEDAIQCYVKAIELNPEHTDAWNNLGLSLLKIGRTEEAKECNIKVKKLKQKFNNIEELKRKYVEGLITYDQYQSGILPPNEQVIPSITPKQSNENLQWAFYVSLPIGVVSTLLSGISILNGAAFIGSIIGGMLIPFVVVYLLLEYVFNRPKDEP